MNWTLLRGRDAGCLLYTSGDPGYAVTTFVLKFIIGITCGAVAHKVFKLRELDKHAPGYLAKVIVAAASGLLLNVFTDPFLGYFRNVYIFGQEYTCLLYTSPARADRVRRAAPARGSASAGAARPLRPLHPGRRPGAVSLPHMGAAAKRAALLFAGAADPR